MRFEPLESRTLLSGDAIVSPAAVIDANLGNFTRSISRAATGHINPTTDGAATYRFRVTQRLYFTILVDRLQNDLDATLSTVRGGTQTQLVTATTPGRANEAIRRWIEPGTYVLQVHPNSSAASNFRVVFTARTSGPAEAAEPGDGPGEATGVGVFAGPRTRVVRDGIGGLDEDDYLAFRVTRTLNVDITLGGLGGDLDLFLYRYTTYLTLTGESDRSGTRAEQVTQTLEPGLYYVRVAQYGTASSNYTLRLTTSEPPATSAAAASDDLLSLLTPIV